MLGVIVAGALAVLIAGVCQPAELPVGEAFIDRSQDGWFWYEPPRDPLVAADALEARMSAPHDPSDAAGEVVGSGSGSAPLSAAWIRERLPDFRDRAIDDPSPDNIQAYLYLQKIALERAGAFAEATSRAVMADPWLDANTERPLATFAAQAVSAKAGAARRRLLQDIADGAGVLFFYRQGCAACAQQAGVLDVAARAYGMQILPIALDGSRPPSPFRAFRTDAGQSQALGVVNTPALFLVRPPDVILPLSQGALDLDTLGERILAQAHAAGWLSDADYAATRPFIQPFALPPSFDDMPSEAVDDPARMVAYLRAKLGVGDEESEP